MAKKLVVAKKGCLTRRDENKLNKAGYVVIEVENKEDFTVYDEFGDLERDLLLSCALQALDHGNESTARVAFGNLLRKSILAKRGVR